MQAPETVRIDKWLWAVRLYKTRSVATDACNAGKVQIDGHSVKPARSVHVGETVSAVCAEVNRTVKVLQLVAKRVGAKLVADFLEDLTPASEYEKQKARQYSPVAVRPPGAGRPTKKDRRSIIKFIK